MTWYLGITTTGMIAPWPGADKERGEFAVERQLRDIGIEAFAPRRIDFKRVGKKRYAEPITSAYLPGYIFADIPAELFSRAIQCRGLRPTMMAISDKEVRKQVLPFLQMAEDEEAEAQRIIDRQDRAAMCAFTAGQALDVLSGPFQDRAISFLRMVQTAHDMHPMIEGEADFFGRSVKVRLDPLDVRTSN